MDEEHLVRRLVEERRVRRLVEERRRLEEERKERRLGEALRLRFEFFKQISTLGAAVSVVVVAIYRDITLPFPLVVVALAAFGLSILVAVGGMWWTTMNADIPLARPAGYIDWGLVLICSLAFGVGALVLLVGALSPAT